VLICTGEAGIVGLVEAEPEVCLRCTLLQGHRRRRRYCVEEKGHPCTVYRHWIFIALVLTTHALVRHAWNQLAVDSSWAGSMSHDAVFHAYANALSTS
jgi:hypothetical protein